MDEQAFRSDPNASFTAQGNRIAFTWPESVEDEMKIASDTVQVKVKNKSTMQSGIKKLYGTA
jgi:hypothetical protein